MPFPWYLFCFLVGFCWVMWQILPTKDREDPTTYQRFLSSGKTSLLAKPILLQTISSCPWGTFKSHYLRALPAVCIAGRGARRAAGIVVRMLSCSSSSPNRSVNSSNVLAETQCAGIVEVFVAPCAPPFCSTILLVHGRKGFIYTHALFFLSLLKLARTLAAQQNKKNSLPVRIFLYSIAASHTPTS